MYNALVLTGLANFRVVANSWPGNAIHAHKSLGHLRGSPHPFQSNVGPTQERDKWRVPP